MKKLDIFEGKHLKIKNLQMNKISKGSKTYEKFTAKAILFPCFEIINYRGRILK